METSDIELIALIFSILFSVIALWQTRGAKRAAADADQRASKAIEIAEQQAASIERLASQIALTGPQPIAWKIDRTGDSQFVLSNAGNQTQHAVEIDPGSRHSGTPGIVADVLEPNGMVEMIIPRPPRSIRVACRAEPEGRIVPIPPRL